MKTSYETARLCLRICTRRDARAVLDFYQRNMEDFARYEPLNAGQSATLRYQESVLDAEWDLYKRSLMVRYYFFEKDNPFRIVGTFAFRNIQRAHFQSAMLGYKVDGDFRRRGFAKEAIGLGIERIFAEEKLHRIEAIVLPDNIPSIRLLESLGFIREGLLLDKIQIDGVWRDHYQYARINAFK